MTGQELKELRIKYGLTQSQVGDEIGVGKSKISEWESGKYEISNAYQRLLVLFFNGLAKS